MAAELRRIRVDVLDQSDECVDGDRFGLGASTTVVAVELAAEADAPIDAAQRDFQLAGDLLEGGAHELRQVAVLVGVEVRRISPDEQAEAVELTPQVVCGPQSHGGGGPCRSSSRKPGNPPVADLDVQTKPEVRAIPCAVRRLECCGALHHEARARHDAFVVGVEDPPIDAPAIAEIVRIDDQIAHAHTNGAAGKVGTLLL